MPSKFSGSTLCTDAATPAPFKRQRDARDQAAAGTGRQHLIQRHAQAGGIFGDFQAHRALPGDDAADRHKA